MVVGVMVVGDDHAQVGGVGDGGDALETYRVTGINDVLYYICTLFPHVVYCYVCIL